jgi:acetate kinase
MKILVLNRGSSSVKSCLYDFQATQDSKDPLWEAQLSWKNNYEGVILKVKNSNGKAYTENLKESTSQEAIKRMIHSLIDGEASVLTKLDEVDVIGHRIVHGGKYYTHAVLIDSTVKKTISLLADIAPLHNPPGLEGIEILETLFPHKPQVAVFDTSFHHTMPESAKIYPIPYHRYQEGIQRFGFHGISYQYCLQRASEFLNQDLKTSKIIIAHLGSGASLCAIREGKSIDTSMGFTPLEGLMMDTRSGTIDPGILIHLSIHKKLSPEAIRTELNQQSGLLGVSGISSDMRDIIQKTEEGDPRATVAFDVYLHRLTSLMGSMLASLNGLDLLVFTAGIGENASFLREKICANFSFLGLTLDERKNKQVGQEDCMISLKDSKVKVLVIHTNEAYQIAQECKKLNIKR